MNAKRVYRIMSENNLLLLHDKPSRQQREHKGRISVKEKYRNTERQIQEAQERISALQEEMAETLGEQYDPVLPSALRQSSARKPLPASLPRETRGIRPEEECCPACGGDLSPLGCDVSEQLELISSAFKHNVRYWPVAGATISCRHQYLQNPLHAVMPERGFWPMLSPGNMQTICRYTASQKYTVVREWS